MIHKSHDASEIWDAIKGAAYAALTRSENPSVVLFIDIDGWTAISSSEPMESEEITQLQEHISEFQAVPDGSSQREQALWSLTHDQVGWARKWLLGY